MEENNNLLVQLIGLISFVAIYYLLVPVAEFFAYNTIFSAKFGAPELTYWEIVLVNMAVRLFTMATRHSES